MFHLIPAPFHRALYRLAHRARIAWLQVRGGETLGCSVIGRDRAGRVLLVRHSYGSGAWAFPGGGMAAGEDPLAAALREFGEELRCGLDQPHALGTIVEPYHGALNVVHLFTGLVDGEPSPDLREIMEARFFARDALPEPIAASVARRLALLDNA